jgi:glycosyltransferase involved in cell wall biosynthesis
MMKIAHLTSAHPRNDTRIFLKMCSSLASHGHTVSLVVADGKSDEISNDVRIFDAGASTGRFDRIRNAPGRVLAQALALDADLYHLHDPELIPIGLKLKRLGHRVVFDSHEDVPKQMLSKPYLNKPALWFISKAFSVYEAWACANLDGVIAATPFIRDKFLSINHNTVDINNFPMLRELTTDVKWDNKQLEVCYVGGIAKIRGIVEVCQAMGLVQTKARLNLCGVFSEPDVEHSVKAILGWQRVNEFGFVDRAGVRDVLSRSVAGLVTLHPVINYIDALPVKMFEYMSAGIPVIASDFPLWREIIQGNDCGLLVDPLDPAAIAKAIDYLVTNPAVAHRMGANGRKAVNERYNWVIEEQKLFAFYERTISQPDK